jgi:hypothetical protein
MLQLHVRAAALADSMHQVCGTAAQVSSRLTRLTALRANCAATSSGLQGLSALPQLRELNIPQLTWAEESGQLCAMPPLFHGTALTTLRHDLGTLEVPPNSAVATVKEDCQVCNLTINACQAHHEGASV